MARKNYLSAPVPTKAPVCYLLVRGKNFQQEHYESASNDARKRAAELRKAGFRVTVSPLGQQITKVGKIRMTLLTIHEPGDREIPPPRTEAL